ncbi:BtpA/SgcQ family protein [Rhodospirillum rubrum]|uniref:Photosystem I assembly BtpA n=1 Tax=Rhodospirillum rubrum (strain ATCC 11170 / ATH 1.1.1 / DSM 467 / LMG 4362 / NCIMB 8255 / S1) TaxID=269796 RepID=Q2RUX8_RHORT|nr:BtpA/SgcQ family protein [Rhodospirillum rubrum]ABC22067.1 Photosystem I assembly BtpA [Rhodospirillum rubrum ATCC 11170]AEO47779.1 photosystem I assembly BtpA [Rhodospirillum rubrum F11]MBK5953650.1 SgcQ protein [Rhodospirillum rubrum]QXG81720.1 BtpA/SgcQ family protein [Rhodospirillum rubrum]HCF17534.1 SgcQ protein [Rhodospirillum rubrum]
MIFDFLGPRKKAVIAMAHIGALPGTPLYDADGGMMKLIDDVVGDIEKLQKGGVHAIMFGNENDRPYQFEAPIASVAAMTAIISAVRPMLSVPFGVNYLWDPAASVAIAVATGASFAREIFTGVFASDMGVWSPNAAEALRLRRNLHRPDLKLLFNINAEFASSLDSRSIGLRARSAIFSSLADAILVSGPLTGQPAQASDLREVREAIGTEVPLFANTGVRLENVDDVLSIADGCVIGTHFKVDGSTWNRVDGGRVSRFMDKVATLV